MGPFNTDGLAKLAVIGFIVMLVVLGIGLGFGLASIINLGKLCL